MTILRRFPAALLACTLLAACSWSASNETEVEDDAAMMAEEEVADEQPVTIETAVTTVRVVAGDTGFQPDIVRITLGQRSRIALESAVLTRTFSIVDLGVHVDVVPGTPMVVDIPTDQAGTFTLVCDAPCGPDGKDVAGQIVVE